MKFEIWLTASMFLSQVCPVCDEKVGEDVTGKLISLKVSVLVLQLLCSKCNLAYFRALGAFGSSLTQFNMFIYSRLWSLRNPVSALVILHLCLARNLLPGVTIMMNQWLIHFCHHLSTMHLVESQVSILVNIPPAMPQTFLMQKGITLFSISIL